MKKTTLTVAAACCLALAGCSEDSPTTDASMGSKTESATTESSSDKSAEESSDEESSPNPTLDSAPPSATGQPGQTSPTSGAAQPTNTSSAEESSPGSEHPFGTPVVSGPCGLDELLKPGVTAKGQHVVCIRDTVNEDRGVWVDGPAPSGEIVKEGDPCVDGPNGDRGAQDKDGNMMLCAGDQWVYGP